MTVVPDVHLAECEHSVEFYERDEDLVEVVIDYLGASLRDGEAAVVIGTAEHRAAVSAGLAASGVDVKAASDAGRLVLLDAQATLAELTIDGGLDQAAFETTVGKIVRDAAAGGRHVRAYGEMVALLWESGGVAGALELERFWNALGQELTFSLLCAYPSQLMSAPAVADAFSEMCSLHRRVLHGAPTPPETDVTRRFARNPEAPRQARRFVAETLTDWGRPDLMEDAVLVASELATNAIRHAGSEFTLSLSRWNGGVTLMVGDASADPPTPRDFSLTTPGGLGLHLVSASASRWGHFPAGVGKLVWAHVDPEAESEAG